MQEARFEKYEEPAEVSPSRFARVRGVISTAIGALVALSLLLVLGVWFYRLGVRDAQNVPIIRASTDPAKIRPQDPGGTTAPHQDVKSYEIAEAGEPSAVAALVAPEPAKPAREDVAMGELKPDEGDDSEVDRLINQAIGERAQEAEALEQTASVDTQPTQPVVQQPAAQPTAPAVKPAAETPSEPEAGDTVVASIETAETQDTANALPPVQPATPADEAEAQAQDEQPQPEITTGTAYAPAISPRAPSRPANLAARVQSAAAEAQQDETNLASAAANSTIQIQLAADPSKDAIRSRWRRVYNANKDLLREKALAIQTTQSGGTTFYRLRVGPFTNRSEAVAVCQALKARGQDCLVARNG